MYRSEDVSPTESKLDEAAEGSREGKSVAEPQRTEGTKLLAKSLPRAIHRPKMLASRIGFIQSEFTNEQPTQTRDEMSSPTMSTSLPTTPSVVFFAHTKPRRRSASAGAYAITDPGFDSGFDAGGGEAEGAFALELTTPQSL